MREFANSSRSQERGACGFFRASLGTVGRGRRVPYPLIPETRRIASDPRWAVPELVGFLLHPVSRSETRRRLKQLHANFGQTPLARGEKTGRNSPGERVDLEETTANRQQWNYIRNESLSQWGDFGKDF